MELKLLHIWKIPWEEKSDMGRNTKTLHIVTDLLELPTIIRLEGSTCGTEPHNHVRNVIWPHTISQSSFTRNTPHHSCQILYEVVSFCESHLRL
jgi:hypothetical protein